jgi:hypothetical protein
MQDMLVDALLDPKLARRLIGKASPKNVGAMADYLAQRVPVTAGVSMGASADAPYAAVQPTDTFTGGP